MIKINEKYQPLYTTPNRYIYVQGGRGSGKSVAVADFISRLCLQVGHRVLWLRYTMSSAEISVIPEFESTLELNGLTPLFDTSKTGAECTQTESKIIFKGVKTSSGNQTAALKSIPNITTLVYEEFEEHPDEHSFNEIDLSIRKKGIANRIVLISNALHEESWQYKRWFEKRRSDTTYISTTFLDNLANLNDDYIKKAKDSELEDIDYYNRYYLGHHYSDNQGALWKAEHIQYSNAPEDLDRIIIAIDPAVTNNAKSDETGIIVAGKKGNRIYILEDLSGRHDVNQWANIGVDAYNRWQADCIVGEKNNGGDLIEQIITSQSNFANFKEVWASRGKTARAEPIANLYQKGLVYHNERFNILENQMKTWVPGQSKYSPDRMDALVWACSELTQSKQSMQIL